MLRFAEELLLLLLGDQGAGSFAGPTILWIARWPPGSSLT